MEAVIRKARKKDYEEVSRIYKQVHDLHVSWRPDLYKAVDSPLTSERFSALIEKESLIVAEIEGVVKGVMELVFIHLEHPVQVTRDILVVDTLAVEEGYRRKGIGSQLLDKAREIQREKNFDKLELHVNSCNREAYEMYRKFGFKEKDITMEL